MLVTKADGTTEEFKVSKLKRSLKNAGASHREIAHITNVITDQMVSGMRTQEIYRDAFQLLRESEEPAAAKYSLRRALFGLGPTGFPFEDFLARLFENEGFVVKRRIHIKGKCASHEIDVAGYSSDASFIAEAKFHSRPGVKSDLQVALYSYARYLDLQSYKVCKADTCGITDFYLITNTKFTSTAIRYAECVGLKILSWNYPKGNSLQDRIEKAGLYPVTVFSQLSNSQKRQLLEKNALLCRDVLSKQEVLKHIGLSQKKIQAVIHEARQLCH